MKPRVLSPVSLVLLFTLAVLATTACAQNLITNGDFAKVDSNGNPTGWLVQKFDIAPSVVSFDTDGAGADNAFSVVMAQARAPATSTGS